MNSDASHPNAQVMGILNVTPDSFSDGGHHRDLDAAVEHALAMVEQGASIIDVGGESTRPGAEPVSVDEELCRVIPVIEALVGRVDVLISIDTRRAAVMTEATQRGAAMINDVAALREPGSLEAAARADVTVCLTHMRGTPRDMQKSPRYDDVVAEVGEFLSERVAAAESAGIAKGKIVIDPGFGFGKSLAHNLALLAHLDDICALGSPVLVGLSRKSMFGALLGLEVHERVEAGVAAAVMAVQAGATIVRTHDVAATVQALGLVAAVRQHRAC